MIIRQILLVLAVELAVIAVVAIGVRACVAATVNAQRAEGAMGRRPLPPIVGLSGVKLLTLRVRPVLMLWRGDIDVEAHIPRDAANRSLSIAWTSDAGSVGSTLRPLEGEDAPVLHTLALRSQPAANYLFVAAVFDRAGKLRGRDVARIHAPEAK